MIEGMEVRIAEAEVTSNFAAVLEKLKQGDEVIVEQDHRGDDEKSAALSDDSRSGSEAALTTRSAPRSRAVDGSSLQPYFGSPALLALNHLPALIRIEPHHLPGESPGGGA
jgi:hypothetical protein